MKSQNIYNIASKSHQWSAANYVALTAEKARLDMTTQTFTQAHSVSNNLLFGQLYDWKDCVAKAEMSVVKNR